MNIVTQFDPSSATSGTFNMVLPGNRGKMLIYNESNINLKLTFANGYTTYVPAWVSDLYCIHDLSSPIVKWAQFSTLTSSGAPISQIIIVAFEETETVSGTYPAALVRQTNIGNTVTASVGSITTLTNDGNTNGTQFIESTPTGAGSSTVSFDNAGNVTIKGNNAGTLTTLLQLIAGASPSVKLAAAAVLTEALGNLKVDGTLESVGAATLDSTLAVTGTSTFTGDVTFNGAGNGITVTNNSLISGNETVTGSLTVNGAGTGVSVAHNLGVTGTSSLDNGNIVTDGSGNVLFAGKLGVAAAGDTFDATTSTSTYIKTRASGNINFQNPNGTTVAAITTGGLSFNGFSTGITWKTGDTISGTHSFTGTTTGTYTHGAGGSPFIVIPMCDVSGSQTMGYDTVTSTQVHITSGAGLGFKALTLLG